MNSKQKGNRGERELLEILREAGLDAHRNQQGIVPGESRPRGGLENPDIACTIADIPLHIEVKRKEKINVYEAMDQAVRDANGRSLPIVAHRRNNKKWLVIAQLDDLIKLFLP